MQGKKRLWYKNWIYESKYKSYQFYSRADGIEEKGQICHFFSTNTNIQIQLALSNRHSQFEGLTWGEKKSYFLHFM